MPEMPDHEIIQFLYRALEHEIEQNGRLWYVIGYQESAIEHGSPITAIQKKYLQKILDGEIDPFDPAPPVEDR